mgnify:CR=1 FL=1
MDELTGEVFEDELDLGAPGVTCVLGEQGWEIADYVEPGSDWERQDDGSYLSPDGTARTWLTTETTG